VPANVLVVFPPGLQTDELTRGMRRMFAEEATQRGWILVTPRPPKGDLFVTDAKELMPPLLADLDATVRAAGARYHVAGASNGGMSAFAFCAMYPERTASVLGFPGALPREMDEKLVGTALKAGGVKVRAWVGEQDHFTWRQSLEAIEKFAKKYELDAVATTVDAEGHIIRSLNGRAIMDELMKIAPAATAAPPAEELAIFAVLDELHAAAARADGDRYFALYAPEAVFIGTDAGERWTLDEFKAYAEPLFVKGKGWKYTLRANSRHVTLVPETNARVAFFEELLDNEKYGTCRGTGVLRLVDGKWLVCQYHLTFPVPNDVAERVTTLIKTEEKRRKK
jgi:pimeloyl-ACP methyl ester carboxylesterase